MASSDIHHAAPRASFGPEVSSPSGCTPEGLPSGGDTAAVAAAAAAAAAATAAAAAAAAAVLERGVRARGPQFRVERESGGTEILRIQ